MTGAPWALCRYDPSGDILLRRLIVRFQIRVISFKSTQLRGRDTEFEPERPGQMGCIDKSRQPSYFLRGLVVQAKEFCGSMESPMLNINMRTHAEDLLKASREMGSAQSSDLGEFGKPQIMGKIRFNEIQQEASCRRH